MRRITKMATLVVAFLIMGALGAPTISHAWELEIEFQTLFFNPDFNPGAREAAEAGVLDALAPFHLEGDFTLKIRIRGQQLGNNPALSTLQFLNHEGVRYTPSQWEIIFGEEAGNDPDILHGTIEVNAGLEWDLSLEEDDGDDDTYSLREVVCHEMDHQIGFIAETIPVGNSFRLYNGIPTPYVNIMVDDEGQNLIDTYGDDFGALADAVINDDPGLFGPMIEAFTGGESIPIDNQNLPAELDRISHLVEGLMMSRQGAENWEFTGGRNDTSAVILADCGLPLRAPSPMMEDLAVSEGQTEEGTVTFDNLLVRVDLAVSATSANEDVLTVEVVEDDGEYSVVCTVADEVAEQTEVEVTVAASGWQQTDWNTETVVTVTVNPVNDPPFWVSYPDEGVEAGKTDTVTFDLEGDDVDSDVTIVMSDRDGLPDDQSVTVTDHGDGTADFSWVTTNMDAGEYHPEFTLSDGESDVTITVDITVTNQAPVVQNDIEDQEFEEDCGCLEIALLDTVFGDPEDDELEFSVDGPDALGLSIDDGTLQFEPDSNFCTPQGGLEVTVTAEDVDEASVSLTFVLTINPIPDPPVVVDEDGTPIDQTNAQVAEGQEMSEVLYSIDVDVPYGDNYPVWSIHDRDGLPDQGPELINTGEGQAEFSWTPAYNTGPATFYPTFRVADQHGLEDFLTVFITVTDVNRDPVLSDIPDFVRDEDSGIWVVCDLDTVAQDPDEDPVEFLFVALDSLGVEVDDENILSVNPWPNFNAPQGVVVTVTAIDGNGGEAETSFTVTVTPVNDDPEVCVLVAPADGSEVNREDMTEVMFSWEVASDVDGDELEYELRLRIPLPTAEVDTTIVVPTEGATEVVIDLETLLTDLGILAEEDEEIPLHWLASVSDGTVSTESEEWGLIVPVPLDVTEWGDGLPREFSVSTPYPNPFNSTTRIAYALPRPADVRLVVVNIMGQTVSEVNKGVMPAGRHHISFKAHSLGSGVYFFVLTAGEYRSVGRVMLVR